MEMSDFFHADTVLAYFLLSPYKRNSFPSINPAQVGSLIPRDEEQRRDGATREATQRLVPLSRDGWWREEGGVQRRAESELSESLRSRPRARSSSVLPVEAEHKSRVRRSTQDSLREPRSA